MIEWLLQADGILFRLINSGCANEWFDCLMPFVRNRFFWAPLYLFILSFLIIHYPYRWWSITLYVIVAVFLADQASSSFLKPLIHRLRPCHDVEQVVHIRLLVACGGTYGFPSSHAANHFAFATFFSLLFPDRWIVGLSLSWAALIGFAQIYVGVHFPLDIIGGAAVGVLCGYVMGSWYLNKMGHSHH